MCRAASSSDYFLSSSIPLLASGGSVTLSAVAGAVLWKELRGMGRRGLLRALPSPRRPLRRKSAVMGLGGFRGHMGISAKDIRGPHRAERNTDPQAQQLEGKRHKTAGNSRGRRYRS